MSAGFAERIVVNDRSEGPMLQKGASGKRPQKNDPFYFSLLASSVVSFSCISLRLFSQYRHPVSSLLRHCHLHLLGS